MSKKLLLSGVGAAFVLALTLQVSPVAAGERLAMTSTDNAVKEHVISDLKPLAKENASKDLSEVQTARLFGVFGR